ncbi:hypothetical protein LWI29_032010 [Acer saccharum]|uniref:Uncharacterized protein n=1 Tax=Acer saccharum TaxID=4024 RepID=A0AA39SYX3_ACESA|nr:hypothetical protein LWI29_032010 [Acer saccharum]
MEAWILNALEGRMRPVNALCFVGYFTEMILDDMRPSPRIVKDIIIQAAGNIDSTRYRSSVIAASGVFIASSGQFPERFNECFDSFSSFNRVNMLKRFHRPGKEPVAENSQTIEEVETTWKGAIGDDYDSMEVDAVVAPVNEEAAHKGDEMDMDEAEDDGDHEHVDADDEGYDGGDEVKDNQNNEKEEEPIIKDPDEVIPRQEQVYMENVNASVDDQPVRNFDDEGYDGGDEAEDNQTLISLIPKIPNPIRLST